MLFLNIFYLVLAILGLSFLIFIHELGHYFVARRNGIRVEVFSIGFGPAFRQWKVNGVKWQICILPFGGYVKMAGMEKQAGLEPHQISDGFYGKTPFQRIKVALAGPITNFIFAFVAFTVIWMAGGQDKSFQELTHIVGFVDSNSALKSSDINPGDVFNTINGKTYDGYPDLLTKLALSDQENTLQGDHLDYWTGSKSPFTATLPKAKTPQERAEQFGMAPAQYLIFNDYSSPAAPLKDSGIEKGDRVIWVDGSLIFSQPQLSTLINESTTLLTLQRENDYFQIKVPRLKINDLRLSQNFKDELDDWRHEAALSGKLTDLYFIPYQISSSGLIEDALSFMNSYAEEVSPMDQLAEKVQSGDRIVAVNGAPAENVFDLFSLLQERSALVIVQKKTSTSITPWSEADASFETSFDTASLSKIIDSIGTPSPLSQVDNLQLLKPVRLKPLSELDLDAKTRAKMTAQYEALKKEIEKIEDPQQRELYLQNLEQSQKRLMLGAHLADRTITFNPPPTKQFIKVLENTWKTLTSLFSGAVHAKHMSGPVGIVQALQNSWSHGILDALYWLGFVSLNLAILNLLPIPVFDGGHVLFSVIEIFKGKPIRAKTMERWVIPFVILLVLFFIYLTYQDIVRLLHKLF
ncbi:MAG: RIP metalloprotease RseP [Rhabdochlamydiaceae bacterium]|nr:RIP metalloprotease RseP [Rhabdochlamydiaceae bacterium]